MRRTKNVLDDSNYIGEDKGQQKEKEPTDIILFYDPKKGGASYLNDFSAIDAKSDKTIAQSINIGTYKKIDEKTYQLVRHNTELDSDSNFVFIRVKKDDSFKLKEQFNFNELKEFQERTMKPENKGLGIVISNDGGNITNMPAIGLNPVEYRYDANKQVSSMHNGNKIISVKEKV